MNLPNLEKGHRITGRWSKKHYTIVRPLGRGGIAGVFLAVDLHSGVYVALKISQDLSSLTREYTIMEKISRKGFCPRVYELDDCSIKGENFNFIAMEYIPGITLKELIGKKVGMAEALSIAGLLAVILNILHRSGFIYCDLKPENIIYDRRKGKIVIIDFGGAVKKGEGVLEFTPVFDRACWGIGSRRADERYDIFALTILLYILLRRRMPYPSKEGIQQILSYARKSKLRIIEKGLLMKYRSMKDFFTELNSLKVLEREKTIRKRYDRILNPLCIVSISIFISLLLITLKKMGF